MVNREHAKGRVSRETQSSKRKYKKWYLIFDCVECGKEILVLDYTQRLKIASGKCQKCASAGRRKAPKRRKPYESLYKFLVYSTSRRKHVDIDLTYDEFLQFAPIPFCFYCGAEVTRPKFSNANRTAYHLDRKDSKKGYRKDNIVSCCRICNITFGDRFSFEEKIVLAEALTKIRQTRQSNRII